MKSEDVTIRADNRLAGILDVPQNSRLPLPEVVTRLGKYIADRKLSDPESNQRDDMDPDRHLDHTVVVELHEDHVRVVCDFCGHRIGFVDFALFTCRRCKKRLSVLELTTLLFDIPSYIAEAKTRFRS